MPTLSAFLIQCSWYRKPVYIKVHGKSYCHLLTLIGAQSRSGYCTYLTFHTNQIWICQWIDVDDLNGSCGDFTSGGGLPLLPQLFGRHPENILKHCPTVSVPAEVPRDTYCRSFVFIAATLAPHFAESFRASAVQSAPTCRFSSWLGRLGSRKKANESIRKLRTNLSIISILSALDAHDVVLVE